MSVCVLYIRYHTEKICSLVWRSLGPFIILEASNSCCCVAYLFMSLSRKVVQKECEPMGVLSRPSVTSYGLKLLCSSLFVSIY